MFCSEAFLEYHFSWIIARCNQDIVEYYRWFLKKKYGSVISRTKESPHISVVRGDDEKETPSYLFNFERQNKKIKFYYSNLIEWNSTGFIWIPVWGQDLYNIRKEVGIKRYPPIPFHISIGKSDWIKNIKC